MKVYQFLAVFALVVLAALGLGFYVGQSVQPKAPAPEKKVVYVDRFVSVPAPAPNPFRVGCPNCGVAFLVKAPAPGQATGSAVPRGDAK